MSEIEELQTRIRNLPTEDFSKLRDWFIQLEDDLWDKKISADFKAGKFNQLIEKARAEFAEVKQIPLDGRKNISGSARGAMKGLLSSVDEFIARKAEEKTLENR